MIAPFTCPPSKEGDPVTFGQEPEIAPGVGGYWFDRPTGIFIPLVFALRPGSGEVGQFLDALPRDRRVVFPTVTSGRLLGMLLRRGFNFQKAGEFEVTDCLVRDPVIGRMLSHAP